MKSRLLTIVTGGIFVVGTAAGWSPAASAPSEDLPDGPGRQTTSARCLPCHGAEIIREQRLAKGGWTREVDKMIGWGASVTPAEKDEIVNYLSARFGVNDPAPVPVSDANEPAAALLARCLTCHGLPLIEEQRLSLAGWKREIDKMVGWGATLTEAEVQLLSEYFSRRFGPAATVTQRANALPPLHD
jgi:cytochrome c553